MNFQYKHLHTVSNSWPNTQPHQLESLPMVRQMVRCVCVCVCVCVGKTHHKQTKHPWGACFVIRGSLAPPPPLSSFVVCQCFHLCVDNRPSRNNACVITEVRSADLKIILLGDSAVGKSKLVERFLMDQYKPRQLSTYGRWPGGVVVRQCWCWCCCTQCDLGVVHCAIA
jgi:hypothetical protein